MMDPRYYSERRTILGHWSPQITLGPPRDQTSEGRRVTLRDGRTRQLEPHEMHLSLGALQAREDARAQQRDRAQYEDDLHRAMADDGIVQMPGPRDKVASGVGE